MCVRRSYFSVSSTSALHQRRLKLRRVGAIYSSLVSRVSWRYTDELYSGSGELSGAYSGDAMVWFGGAMVYIANLGSGRMQGDMHRSHARSLERTLELVNLTEFSALKDIVAFATLVSTYEQGFMLIFEPFETEHATVPNPILRFTCLDASIAIKPVIDRFQSIIITSGTISPLDMYPRMLNFSTVLQQSYTMSLSKRSFLPLVVTKGSDQVAISSRFEIRNDPSVVRNYGNLLIEFSKITPDGLVVFFPSYFYMESIISMW